MTAKEASELVQNSKNQQKILKEQEAENNRLQLQQCKKQIFDELPVYITKIENDIIKESKLLKRSLIMFSPYNNELGEYWTNIIYDELLARGFSVCIRKRYVPYYPGSGDDNYAYACEAHNEYYLEVSW